MKNIKITKESLKSRPFSEYLKERYPTKKFLAEADVRFQRLALGYEIFVARKKKNFTQAKLAKKLNTTQSEIARIESGYQNVTFDKLQKIASALNKQFLIKP